MTLHLEDFLITGRTFEEYCAFFNLDIHALQGKKVLDCPSGVSSFVAKANAHNIHAQGCDLIYQFDSADIQRQARDSIEKIYKDTSWMHDHNWSFYGSLEGHKHHRQQALESFINAYDPSLYRYEQLPLLSYDDNSFDLLLSSHLLFVYDDRLDLTFHLESIAQMLRVAKEVRIFPLIDFKNSRKDKRDNLSPFVKTVLQKFNAHLSPVNFEFQPGGGTMMTISQ